MRPSFTRRAFAVALAMFATHGAFAQDASAYPSQPLRIVVPYPAGGATDTLARIVATKLQESWKQTVVVENKPGASGTIGNDMVAKAPRDGHTILLAITALVQVQSLMPKLPYDALKDLQPLVQVASTNSVFLVPASTPAGTLKEFVALAKANPGKLTHGSSGTGGSLHLGAELFKQTAALNMVHVPYKGAALALTDVIGGHVDSMFISAPGAIAQIKAGKVRVLAIASARRTRALPDAPTFAESGYPDVVVDTRYGLLAPAAAPAATVAKLEAAIAKALATPEVRDQYATLSLDPAPMSPQDYAVFLREEILRWRKVVTAAKLQPQ